MTWTYTAYTPIESLLVIAGGLLAFSVYDTLLHRMWRAVMRRRGL